MDAGGEGGGHAGGRGLGRGTACEGSGSREQVGFGGTERRSEHWLWRCRKTVVWDKVWKVTQALWLWN